MRSKPLLGHRTLACQEVIRKNRNWIDPITKMTGRCGECRTCWRLWVMLMRKAGKRIPRADRSGSIAGFTFTKRNKEQARAV